MRVTFDDDSIILGSVWKSEVDPAPALGGDAGAPVVEAGHGDTQGAGDGESHGDRRGACLSSFTPKLAYGSNI